MISMPEFWTKSSEPDTFRLLKRKRIPERRKGQRNVKELCGSGRLDALKFITHTASHMSYQLIIYLDNKLVLHFYAQISVII